MGKPLKSAALHTGTLSIRGRQVPLTVKHNPRARRIIVRVDLTAGVVQVTAPSKRGLFRALDFAQEQADWIAARLDQVPPPVPFEAGAIVPFRGEDHLIRHVGRRLPREMLARVERHRGGVYRIDAPAVGALPEIHVSGDPEFIGRRVGDWMKVQARETLNESVLGYGARLGLRPARITVRDQTSRWGSCSPTRVLSFSWRLIMAPPFVLDYVAAHEVAHLRHMNHGQRFWSLVRKVIPDADPAKRWLEEHGPRLHRFGPRAVDEA